MRWLPLTSGIVILLAAGVVHGIWTQRWQPSHELQAAAGRLDQVPLSIGDWRGRDLPVEREVIERSGLAAYWTRRYERAQGGPGVTVVLMCGRAGPTSVHTPESCYGAAGYERVGATSRQAVELPTGPPAEFWAADLTKENPALPAHLRILWGWGAEEKWSAPVSPRLTFARRAALFKLYVVRETSGPHEPHVQDPCEEFLKLLLPVLNRTLFPPDQDGV